MTKLESLRDYLQHMMHLLSVTCIGCMAQTTLACPIKHLCCLRVPCLGAGLYTVLHDWCIEYRVIG